MTGDACGYCGGDGAEWGCDSCDDSGAELEREPVPTTERRPRGRCVVCGRSFVLLATGEVRHHRQPLLCDDGVTRMRLRCPGSYSDPEPSILITEATDGR